MGFIKHSEAKLEVIEEETPSWLQAAEAQKEEDEQNAKAEDKTEE